MAKLIAVMSVVGLLVLGGYAAASAGNASSGFSGKPSLKMQAGPAVGLQSGASVSNAEGVSPATLVERPQPPVPALKRASQGVARLHGMSAGRSCSTPIGPPGAMTSNCAAP
jgi:hypothetical protein